MFKYEPRTSLIKAKATAEAATSSSSDHRSYTIIILSGGIAASGDRAHGNAIPRPYALTSEHQNVSANLETW